jgi:hypothetical protein
MSVSSECCQVEGSPLVRRGLTEGGVCEYEREASILGALDPSTKIVREHVRR